jgi:hypothetical protein
MAYKQEPETPLTNNGEFGDKIENRKWSEVKDKDSKEKQYGPKRIHNPDKIIKFEDGTSTTKEEFVRSGDRKDYNKRVAKSAIGQAGLGALGFFIGKNLNK